MNKIILFLCIIHTKFSLALTPIKPESVLSPSEIKEIVHEKNYFLYKNMDYSTPTWRKTKRLYSSHFLGERNHYITLEEVIHRVLTDAFPVQYKLEELYRSQLGLHVKIGALLPKLDMSFGEGLASLNVGKVFSGLFGFLSPSTWMKVVNQKRVYKASKYMIILTILNEILIAKQAYINQHEMIQKVEILNYYFIHLQILARKFKKESRFIQTLIGKFSVDGTEMASQRGRVKIGFDDLSFLMAMEHAENDLTLNRLNIKDLTNFPKVVKDTEDLEEKYQSKNIFLHEVVKKSIELKIAKEFFKISKLNIGIVATGAVFNNVDGPQMTSTDARFSFNLGYDTLPNILIAKSLKKTAEIDLRKEYISMLNMARRSYDLYTNSLGGYTEAKRSLKTNRKAFIVNLKVVLDGDKEPDPFFFFSLEHLVKSELKLNAALHGSLKARASLERFLLTDQESFSKYFPKKGKILEVFQKIKDKDLLEKAKVDKLDDTLITIKKAEKLREILYHHHLIKELRSYSEEEIIHAVQRNMDNLLFTKLSFRKKKKFFTTLKYYVDEKNIRLTFSQEKKFKKKI